MKVLLTTLNAKYIHTNLALRWLYVARDTSFETQIKEYTIRDDLMDVASQINAINPDVVGLSIYIWNQEESKELVKLLHHFKPSLRIIIGGPEVSFEYNDWLDYPIEGVLRGEGEKTFWQAVRGEKEIDGYVTKTYCSNNPYAKVDLNWLETLESPYFLKMDEVERKNRYLYLETSRGCPYRCSYCLSSLDNQVRLFSEDYVLQQIKKCELIECKQVKFLDRTFNVKPERALRIAQCIEQLDVDFSFQFEVVLDTMSEDLLTFFEKSNKERFRFEVGVQSFNEETLKAVNRSQNLDTLSMNISRLSQAGCILHVDLIGGLPFEDIHSFGQSYTKLFACGASEIQVGILKLLKGTSLRNSAVLYGFSYEESSPYTIQSTQWLSQKDVCTIEDVYHATEKLYNNGRLRFALESCFNKGYPIFEVMSQVGLLMRSFKGQPQVFDYFMMVYEVLSEFKIVSDDVLRALCNTDYMMNFKQTPKPLFKDEIPKEMIKKLMKQWVETGVFKEQELYKYGKIKLGYHDDQIMIQVLIYTNHQDFPKRFWFNLEGERK